MAPASRGTPVPGTQATLATAALNPRFGARSSIQCLEKEGTADRVKKHFEASALVS